MLITDAKLLIKNAARAKFRWPLMTIGSMGIGKTQIVEQAAKELSAELKEEVGFVDLRLATQEPADLIGFPYTEDRTSKVSKEKYKVLCHARPEWFPEEGTRGIIHLDELNRAPTDVRQAIFQFVHERRLHRHVLPDGWTIVSSINPDNGAYQVETLDKAMFRRFFLLKVKTNEDIVLRFFKTIDVDEVVQGFIASHPSLLFRDEEFKIEQENTPDSYKMFSDFIKSEICPPALLAEVAVGILGREAAIAFEKYKAEEYKRPVRGIDVLDRYEEVEKKLSAQKNHEWYITLTELSAELFSSDSPNPPEKRVENVVKFIVAAPGETVAAIMSKLPPGYASRILAHRSVTKKTSEMMRQSRD